MKSETLKRRQDRSGKMSNNIENNFWDGMTEEEVTKFREILGNFLNDYKAKGENITDYEWLYSKLKLELPDTKDEELKQASEEIVNSITVNNKNLSELNEVCRKGATKEKWFADKIQEAAKGVKISEYGEWLKGLDSSLRNANTQMQRAITTNSGNINLCNNLDGFIAEQHQVNTFNVRAVIDDSPYRAEVCAPLPGETYGKDSFDVVIKDWRTGKRVNQYQFKFGKDADATINLLKRGNYNNQRIVVPEEQVAAVRAAFPNKSVQSFIGGNGDISTTSDPLTKESVKNMQIKAQEKSIIPTVDWNSYNTKSLALTLGANVGLAGVQSAAIGTGLEMARKVMSGEKIEADETIKTALKTGADTGIKTATAGALKVAAERGIIKVIPKGTPAGMIANIASVGIENVKILMKVAKGELSMAEALEQMGRTSVSMVAGIASAGTGAVIGAAALSWIPVVGPVIGGLAGGMIAYIAGSSIGSKVYDAAKKVQQGAKSFTKKIWNKAKEIGNRVKTGFSKVFN